MAENPESKQFEITLAEEYAGQRLDQALTEVLIEFSRSRVQTWIKAGCVRVDGETRKPTYKVIGGESVMVDAEFAANDRWLAEPIEVPVIHEDSDLIVINKPRGLVVHPGAGNRHGTLINGLLNRYPELSALPRCGIVHRIDMDTSGLLVVARSSLAHRTLVDQLSRHEVTREYQAIAFGEMTGGGTIDEPIGRHPRHRTRMAVVSGGRSSVTHYRLQQRFRSYTHVRVSLETGRTHQIRVHMAHIHHPLLGDPVYGGRNRLPAGASERLRDAVQSFSRQALHAARLQLQHPSSGEEVAWESPLPTDMTDMLEILSEEDAL